MTFAQRTQDSTPELIYLNRKLNKIRVTTKFKYHEITHVAWNHMNESDTTTGSILLGKGTVIVKTIVSFIC